MTTGAFENVLRRQLLDANDGDNNNDDDNNDDDGGGGGDINDILYRTVPTGSVLAFEIGRLAVRRLEGRSAAIA